MKRTDLADFGRSRPRRRNLFSAGIALLALVLLAGIAPASAYHDQGGSGTSGGWTEEEVNNEFAGITSKANNDGTISVTSSAGTVTAGGTGSTGGGSSGGGNPNEASDNAGDRRADARRQAAAEAARLEQAQAAARAEEQRKIAAQQAQQAQIEANRAKQAAILAVQEAERAAADAKKNNSFDDDAAYDVAGPAVLKNPISEEIDKKCKIACFRRPTPRSEKGGAPFNNNGTTWNAKREFAGFEKPISPAAKNILRHGTNAKPTQETSVWRGPHYNRTTLKAVSHNVWSKGSATRNRDGSWTVTWRGANRYVYKDANGKTKRSPGIKLHLDQNGNPLSMYGIIPK